MNGTMKKNYTIEEVLDITVRELEGIEMPVSLYEKVGRHIMNAVENLKGCLDAIENSKRRAAEEAARMEREQAEAAYRDMEKAEAEADAAEAAAREEAKAARMELLAVEPDGEPEAEE